MRRAFAVLALTLAVGCARGPNFGLPPEVNIRRPVETDGHVVFGTANLNEKIETEFVRLGRTDGGQAVVNLCVTNTTTDQIEIVARAIFRDDDQIVIDQKDWTPFLLAGGESRVYKVQSSPSYVHDVIVQIMEP